MWIAAAVIMSITACHSSTTISESAYNRADSLVKEVVNGNLALKTLAESSEFMYFDRKYLGESSADVSQADFPPEDKVRIQVVAYRIFKQVTLRDGQYHIAVDRGEDIHIPQHIFSVYKHSLENGNAASKRPGAAALSYPENFQDSVLAW